MMKSLKDQLDVGLRAATFAEEHPDANPIITAAGNNLGGLSGQGNTLAGEYQVADQNRQAALHGRRRTEAAINTTLGALQGIAGYAALRRPDTPVLFRMPGTHGGMRGFASRVRGVLEVVNANRELLLTYGMPDTMPEELLAQLEAFEKFVAQRAAAQQERAALREQLAEVARQLMQGVRHLNGLYRIRYAASPELLAAWRGTIALPVRGAKKEDDAARTRPAA